MIKDLLQEDLKNEVYSNYKGYRAKYVRLVNDYHRVLGDNTRTDDYKLQMRDEAVSKIVELKETTADRSLEDLNKLEEQYREKAYDSEVQDLSEIEQLKKVIVWQEILPTMGKEEFKELWIKYRKNEEFTALAESILKREGKGLWIEEMKFTYNPNPLESTFKKHRMTLRSYRAMGDSIFIPNEYGENQELRFYNKDLDNLGVFDYE